jgi:hypothetical protein
MRQFATLALAAGVALSSASALAQDASAPAAQPSPAPTAPAQTPPAPVQQAPAAQLPAAPPTAQTPATAPPMAANPNSTAVPSAEAPSASASQLAPQSPGGRFSFHRVQDTLVRLDSQSGQVSICRLGANGWSCQAVPDDRAALESEIGRLQSENADLKTQLLAHGLSPSDGARPSAPGTKTPDRTPDAMPETRLPSEADLDRAMVFISKAWRRMVEMMAEFQRDMGRKN